MCDLLIEARILSLKLSTIPECPVCLLAQRLQMEDVWLDRYR
jgi:hypothetical protein